MKRTFFSTMKIMSLLLVAAGVLMTSCKDQVDEDEVGKTAISISATIENFEANSAGTTDTSFEEGDAIGLHIITPTKLHLNNGKFTYSAGKFTSTQTRYWHADSDVEAALVAYSPYWSRGSYSAGMGYAFALKTDQSTEAAYKESDLMFAVTKSKPTKKSVNLPFKHLLSKFVMMIDNPNGEKIAQISVSNLSDIVTYKWEEDKIISSNTKQTFTPAAVTIDGKAAYVLMVAPQSVTDATMVTIVSESEKLFQFNAAPTAFESGKAYVATLSLENESHPTQFTPTISDWVLENEGMEFDRIDNDVIIRDSYTISDVDPSLEWPLVATLPEMISDNTDDVVVVVNTQGTDVKAGEALYAHTGVITNLSTGPGDWKYVKHDWGVNADDCKLTHVGNGIYAMVIPYGARAFYGVPQGEEIVSLAFVFRGASGSPEVKNNGNDIFVDLVDADALAVSFVSPTHGELYKVGEKVSVKVVAQNATTLALDLNGSQVVSVEDDEIVYDYTVAEPCDMLFTATATNDKGESIVESVSVAALGATQSAARPAGAKDGVTVSGSEATFVLYAPGKQQVVLLGDFNAYAPSNAYMMKKDGDYFWTTVSDLQPETEYGYQFLVDGTIKVGDPYCEKILDPWNDKWINQVGGVPTEIYPNLKAYPTQTTDIVSVFTTSTKQYAWQVSDFKRPNRHSLVIYELLLRDFTEEGTLRAAIDKLDYLDKLGVNAIELMPVQEFDGNDSWGYNPCFYFAPDKAYGPKDEYKRFVDECHRRGIAVILDVVFNHTTGQFPWAKMWWNSATNKTASDNPFFNVDAPHNWSVYHDLRHDYPKTRSYIKEVLAFWLEEYNIDGYRFDLTKGIVQNPGNYDAGGYSAQRIGWLKEYADAIRAAEGGEDAYIIFEHFCDSSEENELASYKGIMLWRNANEASMESGMGWAGKDNFSHVSAYGRVGFAESHDEERVGYKVKNFGQAPLKTGFVSQNAVNQLTGLYALVYLSPYTKMMWQFGELAYDYSIDMNDKGELGDYRTHRKPIPWKLGYDKDPNRKALYENLCKVISFRTDNPQIFSSDSGDKERKTWNVGSNSMGGKTLVLSNNYGGVIVVANQSIDTATTNVSVPQTGEWTNLITGEKVTLGSNYSVTLKAHECVVLGRVN